MKTSMKNLFLETTVSMHVIVEHGETDEKKNEPNSNKNFVLTESHATKIYLERINEVGAMQKGKKVNHQVSVPKDGKTYANFVTLAA